MCYNTNAHHGSSCFEEGSDFMSEKRRDSKGRILRTGESQRPDGRYQYRYKDIRGERRSIYDWDLHSLREKAQEIQKQISEGVSYFDGKIPLSALLNKTFALKRNWTESTRATMTRYLSIIKTSRIYNMPINKIKRADVKNFYASLHDSGYAFGTIATIHSLLKTSFDMALEDDAILKSPCNFKLKSIVDDDTPKVEALTLEEEESLFEFLKTDTLGQRHIDMMTILIGTGMRISEFAALTINDIDFTHNVIHINKQIVRLVGKLVVTDPKSEAGTRDIPMTQRVRLSAKNLIAKRKEIHKDVMIAGYVGFISVTRNGRPRTHSEYADAVRLLMERYNEASEVKIDRCTPHVLRHTFCTRCIASGMDVKTVQYLMGHSDASTTLNIYADNDFDNVVTEMKRLERHIG